MSLKLLKLKYYIFCLSRGVELLCPKIKTCLFKIYGLDLKLIKKNNDHLI